VTIKPIRWFEVSAEVPPAFHNPSQDTGVVCLNYKDHDDRSAGLEPWWLLGSIAVVVLISESAWGPDGHWSALEQSAQQMLSYAESDDDVGFKEGDFYGIFWVQCEAEHRAKVHIGLAYANSNKPLRPITGVIERTYPNDDHTWVTPQCALPLQVEVQLMSGVPKVTHRVSRYKRSPVI
jgi:hypothetical protein